MAVCPLVSLVSNKLTDIHFPLCVLCAYSLHLSTGCYYVVPFFLKRARGRNIIWGLVNATGGKCGVVSLSVSHANCELQ